MEEFLINKKKLKRKQFKIVKDGDCKAVSIVTKPAIESSSQYFNQVQENFKKLYKFSSDEKMQLTGPAMRANYDMVRIDDNEEYYLGWFSKEQVQSYAKAFFKNGHNTKANFEHQRKFNKNIFAFESWIVEDKAIDKAAALGFKDYEAGDWFITYQFTDIDDWEYAKNNGFTGLSVEVEAAVFSFIENFSKEQIQEMKIKEVAFSDEYSDLQKELIIKQILEIE